MTQTDDLSRHTPSELRRAFNRGLEDYKTATDLTMPSPYEDPVLDWAWKAGFDHAGLAALNRMREETIERMSTAITHAKNLAAALKYFGAVN